MAVRVEGMHAVVERDGVRDEVAVEEPLEIRVDGAALAVTMRTPGHDEELAAGFLYGEGLLEGPPVFRPDPDLAANRVDLAGPLRRDPGARRFYTTSSCGVCGKGALEEVAVDAPPAPPGPVVTRELLAGLPGRLRRAREPVRRRGAGVWSVRAGVEGGRDERRVAEPVAAGTPVARWRSARARPGGALGPFRGPGAPHGDRRPRRPLGLPVLRRG